MRKQIVAFSLALLAASSPVAAQETGFLDDIRFFFLAFFDSSGDPEIGPMIWVNGIEAQPETGDEPEIAPMIIVNGVEVHPEDRSKIAPMIIVDGLAAQAGAGDDSEYAPMIVPNG